ncbi:MAG: class I SAM-dependent methyltransferase [Rickettsiella sp.]|nr:class I SAM-dependent methyltransferase [Rickettsiella sp.]
MLERLNCKICDGFAYFMGSRRGNYKKDTTFHYYSCPNCYFSFVGNPWLEFDKIYSHAYYNGKGADPYVDYFFELNHPESTIRKYEWKGLAKVINRFVSSKYTQYYLDYGCGSGGLVRYLSNNFYFKCFGFEEGSIASHFNDISLLSKVDLEKRKNTFDIITAIEVIEHVIDPLSFLKEIRSLLKLEGVFFFTTGNAKPWRGKITNWSYVSVPETHISFFEPSTLALALEKSGFKPEFQGFLPGFSDVIKFKVLKNLRYRSESKLFDVLPWSMLSRLIDKKFKFSHHPIGIAI